MAEAKANPKDLNLFDASNVAGIFFDIDDTFTTDGKITREAFSAIWELKDHGKVVVPITGRPAGWCDHIARMWPVDAVVGENGAFYQMMKSGRLAKMYTADKARRDEFAAGLLAIREEIKKAVPHAVPASDQAYREFDLAIDICEDVRRLTDDEVKKIASIMTGYGATAKISSIHINCWFGDYTKLSTAISFAKNELGVDLKKDNSRFVFCGDSQNDDTMFEFFDKSVGVANVMEFKDLLKHMPKFITKGRSGAGFVELARRLCHG
jgi:HAD superfamily hydrolase (TIGR01484 family)